MCLISYCPSGTDKESQEVQDFIANGFHSQFHGSGYMYKKEGEPTVFLSKGYKSVEAMLADIKHAGLNKEDELAIHHRTSTSGLKDEYNTHPFVVSKNHDEVIALEGKFELPVFMHNGIFRNIEKFEKLDKNFSDTYAFAKYIMAEPQILALYKENPDMFQFILREFVGGSKTLTFFPDRDPIMTGFYFKENGYFHSNECFRNCNYRDRGGVMGKNLLGGTTGNLSIDKTNTTDTKLPTLKLADNISILPSVRLSGSEIRIDSENAKHFYFVKKIDAGNYRVFEFEEFENYGYQETMNLLHIVSGHQFRSCAYAVHNTQLHTEYYFYPKAKYSYIYKDYAELIRKWKASKRGLKKLVGLLRKNKLKSLDDTLNFKVAKKRFTKVALYEYYKYHRDDLLNDPTEKDLVMILPGEKKKPRMEVTSKGDLVDVVLAD